MPGTQRTAGRSAHCDSERSLPGLFHPVRALYPHLQERVGIMNLYPNSYFERERARFRRRAFVLRCRAAAIWFAAGAAALALALEVWCR